MKSPLLCGLLLLGFGSVQAYPLDQTERTGIRRLELAREAQAARPTLPAGARLAGGAVRSARLGMSDLPTADPRLGAALKAALGEQAENYGVALLDLSDPQRPAYAAHQENYQANVGSVGKVLVVLAWLQKLADLYPDDIAARERVLRETRIVADDYIVSDEHKVPIPDAASGRLQSRPLQQGDVGNLWEYLDWMLSASSNAAASMAMKELAAIQHFGRDYPAEQAPRDVLLRGLNAQQRGQLLLAALLPPLRRNGLDPERLRQGSLFTGVGKARISGTNSTATPRELVRLLGLIESGRFVDAWSSDEAKRLLYMTQRRIRYASHPVLHPAAVYFKSGSLYSCAPEPGFVCRKYMGNKQNRLASVALVEYPAGQPSLRYAVAVMSNVLRVNSAVAHQTLALRIHRMVEARHLATPSRSDAELPPARLEDAEGRGGDD